MNADEMRFETGEQRAAPGLTPRQIVSELDRYIIAQEGAKRAVAIALRNRWRRLQVAADMQDEITPKNIIMIGPTGVGKTEISRRLAKLTAAPFVKVEASKFTEVGYVGRDVESIIRDLVEAAHSMVRAEERERVKTKAEAAAEEELLNALLPSSSTGDEAENSSATREKLRSLLREGRLEERTIEIETQKQVSTHLEIMGPPGFAEVEGQLKDMFSSMIPKPKERRRVTVQEARKILVDEAQERLLEPEQVSRLAVQRAEQNGIVFIDEIDKICGKDQGQRGPDVSREGVQRDLLPIVEGSTVSTKYGPVRTDHVLFIASGAFHQVKPSDLMPEFQGRFPIRVELQSLSADHFVRILKEPKNALTKQYAALLAAEGVELVLLDDAIEEIARLTAEVNAQTEDIGARRLHTLLEKLLEDLLFDADQRRGERVRIDREYVSSKLTDVVQDQDLSRFIL
jgi:ATP-dependent HslUV protease ATP-binding subunit HslU